MKNKMEIEIREKMKNQELYNQYAIEGWPCHFFTPDCADMYNRQVEKYCDNLPENETDLSVIQKLFLASYILVLDAYDVFLYTRRKCEDKNEEKGKNR